MALGGVFSIGAMFRRQRTFWRLGLRCAKFRTTLRIGLRGFLLCLLGGCGLGRWGLKRLSWLPVPVQKGCFLKRDNIFKD